jgi:hypothetical protein
LWELVKKYWDLVSGFIVGTALSFIAHSDSEKVRLFYSVVILILACMGMFRFIRQTFEQGKKKEENRGHNLLDDMVDAQIAVKVINLAQEPTKVGEKIGRVFIALLEGAKSIMKKLKELFGKYKGYLLTMLLGVLTAIESYGGFINRLCGGVLVIKGVEVLPLVTLILTIVVGLISNGYSKEQMESIKALLSRSSTAVLVRAEIKNQLGIHKTKHSQYIKIQATKEGELATLRSELEGLKNTYAAKREMYGMTPQLATEEDVLLAMKAVSECETKIANKTAEIEETKTTVAELDTTINALKSQL